MFQWLCGITRRFSIDEGVIRQVHSVLDIALFTDRSRQALYLADREARRLHHEHIGTEHILLGLLAEGTGLAMNVLQNLSIDHHEIVRDVEGLIVEGPSEFTADRRILTPRTKSAIKYAGEEACNLNHNYVGTEHLLLGLLCEQAGLAAKVLMDRKLTVEGVRSEVLKLLRHGQALPGNE